LTIVLKTEGVLLDGLAFPEAPRWRDGELWFSDMTAQKVMRVSLDGKVSIVVEVPGQPSGLGWLPDGRLLVVSMTDRRLLRLDPAGLTVVADLSAWAPFHCNDMVVDEKGRAYVGNFGFDLPAKAEAKPTVLILVTPEGKTSVVAEDLSFPNGSVITADGRTLIVAESFGARLTAFAVAQDGSLSNRRVWARLEAAGPDGICLDAEGAVWVASPIGREVLRVREGGEVTHRIATENQAVACMLGGPDRRTLFVLSCQIIPEREKSCALKSGRIETVRVDVAGVGLP
jgi:sugar lactone lactonase YvrE